MAKVKDYYDLAYARVAESADASTSPCPTEDKIYLVAKKKKDLENLGLASVRTLG